MQRVAALYLPMWPIERLRQAERRAPPEAAPSLPADLGPLQDAAAAEQQHACSVPRGGGWRPGARWARAERDAQIAALPLHQRPPMRELGRRTEAAEPAFKRLRPDEGGKLLPGMGMGTMTRSGMVEGPARHAPVAWTPPSPTAPGGDPPPRSGEELPLVTSLRSGNRVLIAAACPRAQALGLRPGMAVTQARAQVPGLDIRPADPEGDAAALRRLAIRAARRWTPAVQIEGADTLLLEIGGSAHLFGGEARMAWRLLRLLARRGFSARIAIADTAGAAWALAHHAMGEAALRICPPGQHADALAPLPPEALRIEDTAVELLRRLGVDRVGTLAAMPRAPLARRFGNALVARIDQALGYVPEPLDPVVPPQPIAVTRRFAEPIGTAEAIAHWLGILVPQLAEALAEAGLGARRVELVAERVDGVPQRIAIGLARASREPGHLLRLLERRIETIEPGFGIDAMTLHLRRAERLGPHPFAERLDEDVAPDLAPLVDTLATRIGAARLWRSRPVESDVPERSVARTHPLDPLEVPALRLRKDDVRRLDRRPPDPPWHPRWPRPARLLPRPEPLDHVMAELPDQPPRRFTWRGVTHRVVRADGPERITGEWWRRSGEAAAVRDYFQVEDEAGRRFWLFRKGDGERGATGDLSWYLHGMFG